ncbi:hypothetical protein [Photorhabdus namnaonensis]|uniref:Uncharacterized protein n=1 Tax=Photorhabdus namnaonensis TaxID=1851568 RepID=A0A1B8YBS4_9GAMM|nr:hypothetical protein [Photorhabdus namnaonensis]OCA52599.1 hypothetical protein Phpb_04448 [Photorhabdus namnaonensis]
MSNHSDITRLYTMEGATHLYSSAPTLLTTADLYQINHNPAYLEALKDCNIYLIVCRERIVINPAKFELTGRIVTGSFLVNRATEIAEVPFEYHIPEDIVPDEKQIIDIAVDLNGTKLIVITSKIKQIVAVNNLVANAHSDLLLTDTDLKVLYVGQGIGRKGTRTAVDRLHAHSTLQRILAEMSTHFPSIEILLLLYRFEHGRTIISNGGDMNAEPLSSAEEDTVHFNRLSNVKLNRADTVSLAEAGLINYFKPQYNVLIKHSNFSSKSRIKILNRLLNSGITGLIIEIGGATIRSRIRTEHAIPRDMTDLYTPDVLAGRNLPDTEMRKQWQQELYIQNHTHYASFPLTNQSERNTFLHGTVFIDSTEIPFTE